MTIDTGVAIAVVGGVLAIAFILWLVFRTRSTPIVLSVEGGLLNGKVPTPGTVLEAGDKLVREQQDTKDCIISGSDCKLSINLDPGTEVHAVESSDEGPTAMVCIDLQTGVVRYSSDLIGNKGRGRKYIIRSKGFAVGPIATKFHVVNTSANESMVHVTLGTVRIVLESDTLNPSPDFRDVTQGNFQVLERGKPVSQLRPVNEA